jgi:hypothetical protein
VERILIADVDDMPMARLRTRLLAEPRRPEPATERHLFGGEMIEILRDRLKRELQTGANGKLSRHHAPTTGIDAKGNRVVRSPCYTQRGYEALLNLPPAAVVQPFEVLSLQRLLLTLGVGLTDLSRTRDDGGYSFLAPEVTLLDEFDDDDEIPLKRLREIDAVVADRHGYVLSKRGAEVIVVYSGRAGIPARVMTLHKDVCRIKPVSIDIGGKINTERHSVFLSVSGAGLCVCTESVFEDVRACLAGCSTK